MSVLADLQSAQRRLEALAADSGADPIETSQAIGAALAPAAPSGSPGDVRSQAQAYSTSAAQCRDVTADIHRIASSSLPAAWHGQVAETAAEAVAALGTEVGATEAVLSEAAGLLTTWAGHLEWAQTTDASGRAQLENAQKTVSAFVMTSSARVIQALKLALPGVQARIAAAQVLADNAPHTASLLKQYASQAHAKDVTTGALDPLSAVVLAVEADPGGQADSADILSPTALGRASQRLDALSGSDRAAFEGLLSRAQSPQEAAYVYKALAAGYDLKQVEAFDAAIHVHGADPQWLAEHLTPTFNDPTSLNADGQDMLTYKGDAGAWLDPVGIDNYDQGNVGDCVAASTVVAQASLDPVLMLQLTTGYNPATGKTPNPLDDTASALHSRLQTLYLKEYAAGRHDDSLMEQWFGPSSGIEPDGENALANNLLSNATGATFHYQGLGSTAARQAALGQIEASVDAGKPVPFDVTNGHEGHQMLIIGRNGDQLEVYNPWGFTEWVSESQFVDNQLGGLTVGASGAPDGLPTADGVELQR